MASESDIVARLERSLAEVRNENSQLRQEKRQLEEDFQQKRSKFKEMYYAKENSLQEQSSQLLQAKSKINDFETLVKSLKSEIEDIKVVASVSENTKQEAVENLRTNHQQEIESLQRVLEDSVEEQRNDLLQQFDMERKQWEKENSKLKQTVMKLEECLEDRSEEDDDGDNFKQGKTKKEQQVQHNTTSSTTTTTTSSSSDDETTAGAGGSSRQNLIGDFNQHVLVLEKENDTLKKKMHEVCRMLEREQYEHGELKQTCAVSSSGSKLLVRDLVLLKDILTDDQWSTLKDKRSVQDAEIAASKTASSSRDISNNFGAAEVSDNDATPPLLIGGNSSSCSTTRDAASIPDSRKSKEALDNDENVAAKEQEKEWSRKVDVWKERYEEEKKLRSQVEETLMQTADEYRSQVELLTKKLVDLEQLFANMKAMKQKKESNDEQRLNFLLKNCDQMKENLTIVSRERDSLRRNYDKSRHQVDKEVPANTMESLRSSLRKYKEALVAAQMEKGEMENKLQSEMSFLQSELSAVQHSKDQIENALSGEIEMLQAQLSSLQSMRSQFEAAIHEKSELKMKIEQQQLAATTIRSKSKEVINRLREQLASEQASKNQAEENLASSKNQVRSLQESLETSEQVQRDFVKLSQSLQVQLENIRVKEEKQKLQQQAATKQEQGDGKDNPSTSGAQDPPKNSSTFP